MKDFQHVGDIQPVISSSEACTYKPVLLLHTVRGSCIQLPNMLGDPKTVLQLLKMVIRYSAVNTVSGNIWYWDCAGWKAANACNILWSPFLTVFFPPHPPPFFFFFLSLCFFFPVFYSVEEVNRWHLVSIAIMNLSVRKSLTLFVLSF